MNTTAQHTPFNPELHAKLLEAGYEHTFEPVYVDEGTAESGPGNNSMPAYDLYRLPTTDRRALITIVYEDGEVHTDTEEDMWEDIPF